jgi:hypothetical protein
MTTNYDRTREAADAAKAGRGNWRAMRVTLECGHFRLTPAFYTGQGVGAFTSCSLLGCRDSEYGGTSRLVVNVEETGVLHPEFLDRSGKEAL